MNHQTQRLPRNRRGSLLIVALLLSAVTAIGIATYLRLGSAGMQLAHRSFFENAAMNLAEGGLDQAMWCFEQARNGNSGAWAANFVLDGRNAHQTFNESSIGLNATGSVRVFVQYYDASLPPVVTARATLTPASGAPVEKWVQVSLHTRSRFGDGMIAKRVIDFNGNNVAADSWNSDTADGDGNPLTGSQAPYSHALASDQATIASTQITAGAVGIGNADVLGYVATGDPTASAGSSKSMEIIVGPMGSILGTDSAVKGVAGNIDPDRVASDFTYNFDQVETNSSQPPVYTSVSPTWLTYSGAVAATPLGVAGTTTAYKLSNSITGSLSIAENATVALIVPLGTTIKLNGSEAITIPASSRLIIFAEADLDIAGKGLLNGSSSPTNVYIFGSIPAGGAAPASQTIKIAGNGNLNACVYAPNADIRIDGGGTSGQVSGSFVGNNITMTGGGFFHYDTALKGLGGGAMAISQWKELTTAAQRGAMEPSLSF